MRLDVFCRVYILLSVSFDRSTQLFFWVSFCPVVHCAGSCFSGSMRSYVVCFMDPLHSIMRTTTDLDCFMVYFWTGRDLSPGLSSVTWVFVRLLSVYPFNFNTRSFTSVFPYFPYVNFVITCFSCLKFLVLCFLPKKGGWGVGGRGSFPVRFSGLLQIIEFSGIFLFIYYATVPCLPEVFPLFYSMEQFVAYEEGDVTYQDDKQQSGKALPSAVDVSKTADVVSVGVPNLLTSSSLAGPSGPAPDVPTRNLPDLSDVLADPTTLCQVEPVPPTLKSRTRTILAVQASCLRPLLRQLRILPLVTSCESWFRSLQLFQGPFPPSRS